LDYAVTPCSSILQANAASSLPSRHGELTYDSKPNASDDGFPGIAAPIQQLLWDTRPITKKDKHMSSFLAVAPSLLALILAFTTKRVILSLLSAVILGYAILMQYHPLDTAVAVFNQGIFQQLQGSNAQIVIVITIISGFIYLLESSSTMRAFSGLLGTHVTSPIKIKLSTLATGMMIFFTDSGNSLILGPVYRPVYEKLRICREKLAYIVDSTSSPVCVLIPIISWGAYTMGLMESSYASEGIEKDGFQAFREIWFYMLYPLLTLVGVAFVATFGVWLGRMKQVQQNFLAGTHSYEDSGTQLPALSPALQQHGAKVVAVALGTLFLSMLALFSYFVIQQGVLAGPTIRITLALSYTIATLSTIVILHRLQIYDFSNSSKAFFNGMGRIMPILCILILAWTLSDVMAELETGAAIARMLNAISFPIWLLASMIFLIGAALSLATGSSWGTFALMIPISVAVAIGLDAPVVVCIGAAISGGLFGDHTSPISDTTVLSSMSCGVNHMAHVETQFPYAIFTAVLAFFGFILASVLYQSSSASPAWMTVMIMAVVGGFAYYLASRSSLGKLAI
jgi:Na+/H+ antiporter NhaC